MRALKDIQNRYRAHLPIVIGLSLFAYFSYHMTWGERSFARYTALQAHHTTQAETLQDLQARHATLRDKVALMQGDTMSADMVQEQARFMLGYASPDEVMIVRNKHTP